MLSPELLFPLQAVVVWVDDVRFRRGADDGIETGGS